MRSTQIQFLLFLLLLLHLPGCGSSDPFPDLPAPASTSLNPASQTEGSPDFIMIVNGFGFVSNSKVKFNGIPVATAFVSDSELDAEILMGFISFPPCSPTPQPCTPLTSPVTVAVTVDNPDFAGGTSGPILFTITP